LGIIILTESKKYKRTTYFKKYDLPDIGNSIWVPSIKHWRDVIEDYLEIAKRRKNNKLAMFKLQMNLISDIILIGDLIRGYIKLIEDPNEQKVKFPDVAITEENLQYWEREIRIHKIILNALKDIGDSIAWRVLDYDRSLIYNMCVNNEEVGPLTLNIGTLNELHSLGDFANEDSVIDFVFHGITNFLLIDDLTIRYNNGEINFVEVKSGKNPRGKSWRERLERQINKSENIVDIGNAQEGVSSDIKCKFEIIDGKPKTAINNIGAALEQLEKNDLVTKVLSSFLGIGLVNHSLTGANEWKSKLEKLKKHLTYSDSDIFVTRMSIEDMVFTPNKAPWSVCPFDSKSIANILMGKYTIIYFFNLSQFIKEMGKNGWIYNGELFMEKAEEERKGIYSFKKDNFIISIPPLLMYRVIHEGLTIDSLNKLLEYEYRKEPRLVSNFVFMGFEKEIYLWE
jgi:hypothetical protein